MDEELRFLARAHVRAMSSSVATVTRSLRGHGLIRFGLSWYSLSTDIRNCDGLRAHWARANGLEWLVILSGDGGLLRGGISLVVVVPESADCQNHYDCEQKLQVATPVMARPNA